MPQYLSTDPNAGTPVQAPQEPSTPLAGMLPTAGGTVGSLVGTLVPLPGARFAGAALGGALGKGAEMFFDDKADSLSDYANAMALSGGEQLAGEAAGGVIGKGLKLLGRGAYSAGTALLPKTIKQEFPNLAQAGFREGVALTGKGAKKAGEVAGKVSQQVEDKLAILDRAGMPKIDPADIANAAQRTTDKVSKEGLRAAKEAEIDAMRQQFLAENPDPLSLVRTQQLKQAEQRLAQEGYRIIDKGTQQINRVPLDVHMDWARAAREQLEDRAPSIGPMNARLQDLIGLERAAEHASGTGHILSRLGGAGVLGGLGLSGGGIAPAVAAAGAGAALTTPQGLTTTGLALKSAAPAAQAVSARVAALLAQLGLEE